MRDYYNISAILIVLFSFLEENLHLYFVRESAKYVGSPLGRYYYSLQFYIIDKKTKTQRD